MLTSLLTTKLYFPPPRSSLVPRPRLVERLQAGLAGPLTLVSAPAGAGKTTLLSQWRAGPGSATPAAWLSLDAADNDPARFLQYLSAALDPLNPGLAGEVGPLLQSPEPPDPEIVLTLVINHLGSLEGDAVLALDDFHLIDNPLVHTALTFLLDHLPPRLHLALLSRADPPLPLARLRARGQMTEIRLTDLRFTEEECARFLNQVMGLGLTGAQVAALEKRTEGWIAGLQLAALSMHDREDVDGFVSAFTGSNRYIVDYLVEEVLGRQPEKLRRFLLKTSILERLTGPLCDALTGDQDGAGVLAGLERANLFIIPLDDEGRWYRYHHLFADLLGNRLLHFHPDLIPSLHVSASAWFEANGFPDEAIDHALQAQDFERAARLINRDNSLIIYSRSTPVWVKWLQAFPDEFLRSDPWLCIWKAHFLLSTGELKTVAVYIDCAEKILADMLGLGRLDGDDPAYLIAQGDAYAFRAVLANAGNQYESALDFAQKAIQIIPPTARNRAFAAGIPMTIHRKTGDLRRALEVCPEAIASARLLNVPSLDTSTIDIQAKMLRELGQLHQSARVLREALAYAEDHGPLYRLYSDVLHVSLAETYYEWNALEEMDAELENALALSAQIGTKNEIIMGQIARCRLQHARGDLPGACKALEQIEREYRDFPGSAWRDNLTALKHHWQMEGGDLTGLADWIGRVDLNVEARFNTFRFTQLMDAGRVLDALGRHEQARDILDAIHAVAERQGHLGWSIPVLVLQSLVCKKLGDEARALDCLQQALLLAEPEGFVRVFLDEGPAMQELISLYQKQRGRSDYVTHLLAAFEDRPAKRPAPATGGLPEPLSARELEVLQLLAQGSSDKQIADSLVIARETVHKHLKNIYGKLDVHSRTAAAARARELGLLEEDA